MSTAHWFQAKSRRNIKAIKKHSTAVEHRSYLMDASVQVSFSVGDEHEQREFHDEELQIEDGDADGDKEAEATARLLHFSTDEEMDCSSDSDSDSERDSDSDVISD